MGKALILVILVGLGLGFLVPLERSAQPKAEAAQSADAPKPAEAAQPQSGWAQETRLQRGDSGHFYATASVNGQPIEFVVDTGASTVALTIADAQRAGIAVDPSSFEVVGTGASGPIRGQNVTLGSVSLDGKEVRTLRGAVLEGLEVSLLGQSYLSRISGVEMRGDEMVLR